MMCSGCFFSGCTTTTETVSDDTLSTKIGKVDILPSASPEQDFVLEIIHMNDVHSYISPVPVTLKTPSGTVSVMAGGPEAFNSIIQQRRAKNPDLLVISAGDQITGNAANYDLFHGEADAALHGLFKDDYWVFGNHEFDHGGKGIAVYQSFLKKLAPDTVLLNTDVSMSPENPVKDHGVRQDIKTINGHKVVFYGVTAVDKVPRSSNPDPDMTFAATVPLINSISAENEATAPIQVLVTHQGLAMDRLNSSQLKDIDIIVGGDSHSLCGNFSKYGLNEECSYPLTLQNASGHKICVVQANEYGKVLGDLRVSFDKDGHVLSCDGYPFMPLWAETAEFKNTSEESDAKAANAETVIKEMIKDPDNSFVLAQHNSAAEQAMKPYLDKFKEVYKHLGTSKEDLCATRYPGDACVVKNIPIYHGSEVCQVFGQMYMAEVGDANADFFLGNSGMFRIDIRPGEFSEATLLGVTPFGNDIVTVKVKGRELLSFLNQVLIFINKDITGRDGGVPCGYGFTYELDNTKANPVVNIKIKGKDGVYKDLDGKATYTLVTTRYLMKGKDGYGNLSKKKILKDYGADSNLIREYLKKNTVLPLKPEEKTISRFAK